MKITYHEHFRNDLLAQLATVKLHIPGGEIRERALKQNAPCVIAWDRDILAYGWATLIRYGKAKMPGIQVYVAPQARRQGIGTALVHRLMDKHSLWGRTIAIWNYSERARKFFRATIE